MLRLNAMQGRRELSAKCDSEQISDKIPKKRHGSQFDHR